MYGNIFDYNLFWPAEYDPGMTYYKQLDFLFKKVQELEARVAELENESRAPDHTKTRDTITTTTRTTDTTDKWHGTCTD